MCSQTSSRHANSQPEPDAQRQQQRHDLDERRRYTEALQRARDVSADTSEVDTSSCLGSIREEPFTE